MSTLIERIRQNSSNDMCFSASRPPEFAVLTPHVPNFALLPMFAAAATLWEVSFKALLFTAPVLPLLSFISHTHARVFRYCKAQLDINTNKSDYSSSFSRNLIFATGYSPETTGKMAMKSLMAMHFHATKNCSKCIMLISVPFITTLVNQMASRVDKLSTWRRI